MHQYRRLYAKNDDEENDLEKEYRALEKKKKLKVPVSQSVSPSYSQRSQVQKNKRWKGEKNSDDSYSIELKEKEEYEEFKKIYDKQKEDNSRTYSNLKNQHDQFRMDSKSAHGRSLNIDSFTNGGKKNLGKKPFIQTDKKTTEREK